MEEAEAKSPETKEDKIYDSILLLENTSEQAEVVWRYLNGNQNEPEEIKEIYKEWVQGLTKEERGVKLYHGTIKIYGWQPRLFSLQKLENVIFLKNFIIF